MYHKLGLPVPASLYKAKNDIITTDKPCKKPPGPLIRELKHVISTLEDRLLDVEDQILPPEPRQALLDQEERPETLSPPPSALSSRYHHPHPLTPTTRRFCTKRRHVISSSNESASNRHTNQSESEEEEEEEEEEDQTTDHVWEKDEEEIKNHLFAHRKRVRFLRSCIKIQSCWRMVRPFRRFGRHKKRKQYILASHFRAWRSVFRIDKWYLKSLQHKILHNLHDYANEQVRLRQVSDISFQKSTEGGQLSLAVVSLFFQSHEEAGKKALSMLTSKETLDDRWMCGVMRNILSLCINGWRLEARTLKLNRMEASMHMVKAWRLRPNGQWWLGERVHILIQVWKRMLALNKARRTFPPHQPLPTFEDEGHLVEWDEWLSQDHRKRSFVSRLERQGCLILQHLMLTRWKSFMEYQRRQADDASFAQEHFHQALLLRCMLAWDACAKERGRVLRSRVKYLRAWKHWAPINRQLRIAKAATQERIRKLRMQAVLRKWQKEILALHQLVAYRMFHLTEKYNNGSCMAIGYAWTQKRYHLTGFRCFYSWKALSFRRQKWRRFIFLQKKMFAQHVLRVLLRGWQNVCGRRKSTKDEGKLSLEPVASMERCLGLQMAVEQGYVPETALEASNMARLICPDLLQTTNSHYPYQSSSSIFINNLRQSPQIDQLCEAVAQGDFPLIYQMLTDGIQVNGITSDGTRRTALHLACSQASSDYLRVASLLLGAGAWTNVRDAEGRTPLDLTVNAQIAALLHLHRSRLSAHEFTRDEKRHCVDLLSELWNGMSTKLLWRYVAYQLVRQRLVKIKSAITELAVPKDVLQSEWRNYNEVKEATPSSGTVEDSNGNSLTPATSQPEEGDASRLPALTPRETKEEDDERSGLSPRHAEGREGDQSPVVVSNTSSSMPTVISFAKATVEDPPRLSGEVKDKLRALFPSLEQCKRFSHIITYLEKMQLFTDTTLILDSDLLDSLGIDLIRGEVNKTSWRIFLKPETYLLETEKRRRPSDLSPSSDYPVPGSGRRGGIRYQQHDSSPPQAISSLSASLRRRSIGGADRLPPQEHLTSTAGINPAQMTEDERHEWLLDTSDKWFSEWSMKNAAMIQAAIKEQQHGNVLGGEPSKVGATSHNAKTMQIKALIVCSKFVEAKTQWVLQERKALLARDKCLLKQRHNPRYDYRAKVPFANMIYLPKQQQQLHSTMTAGNYVWDDQQKLSVTVANVFSLKYPVLIDVAPYHSMQTYALTVSMRPSLTHSAITNAINFITTQIHTSFWSEAENSSRRRETLKYLPAGWANESYILGNLLVTFRDLKRREEHLTSEFKEINQSLYKMAKTFDEAEEMENEAAEHVVEQSVYMKRKTAAIKNKLGAAAANLSRSKAQYASIKQNTENAEKALADLVMQIQATTSAPRDTKEKAKPAAKSKGGKSPQPDGTPTTIDELLQAKATKETDLQSLQERVKLAAAAVENDTLSIEKADTDREAATAKMKDLCKESLLFVYHATTMKTVYYNDRKALAEKANEVLRRVKRVRWKLQDVHRLITAIRRQVRAHRPAVASVDQRPASSKTKEDATAAPGIDNDLDNIDLNFEQLDTHSLDMPRKGLKATTAALLLAGKPRKNDRRKGLPAKTLLTSLTPRLGDEDEGPASPYSTPPTTPQQHLLEKSSLLSRADPSSNLSVPSAEIVDRQEKEGGEMLSQADALTGKEGQQDSDRKDKEGQQDSDRKDKEAHEEQEGEGREEEESVTTSYSYALFEDPKIMSFLQQAREKAQSDRLPKEPSMSSQTLVDEEERIPEQLYEDSLQRLFASERDQARIKKERKEREEALKKLSADEEQEEDLLDQTIYGTIDALMPIVASANDARTPLAKEGSGLKSVAATPKTSGLFARIWQRVRHQKALLVGMDFATGDVKVDDKLPTSKHCRLDDKSPIQKSSSNERLPEWAHKTSSTEEINGDQSDVYYQTMWASDTSSSIAPTISMATPVKQLEREPSRASLATKESIETSTRSLDESGPPSIDSSATASPHASMSRRRTLGSLINGGTTVEVTHELLLQKTILLTLSDEDFRGLFQLVGEDDFIRSAALYLRSFDGDSSTSVFPLCSSPRSRIVSPAATLEAHLPSPASSSSSPRTIRRGSGSRSSLGISIRSNGSISPSGGQSLKCLTGARGSSSASPPSASQPSEEVAQSTSSLPAEQRSRKAMPAFKSSMSRIFPLVQEEETRKGVADDDNRGEKDALIPPPFEVEASLTLPHQSPKAATLRASAPTKRVGFAVMDVSISDDSKTPLTSPSVLPQASAAVKEETESSFSSTQIHTTEPSPFIATAACSDEKGATEEGTAVVQQRNSPKPLISLSASPRRLMDISSSFMPAAGIIDAPQQQDSQGYLASSSPRTPLAAPLLPSPAGTFPMVSPFCEKQTMQQTSAEQEGPTSDATMTPLDASSNQSLKMDAMDIYHQLLAESPFHRTATMEESYQPSQGHDDVPAIRKVGLLRTPIQYVGRTPCHLQSATSLQQQQQQENEYGRSLRSELRYHGKRRRQSRIYARDDDDFSYQESTSFPVINRVQRQNQPTGRRFVGISGLRGQRDEEVVLQQNALINNIDLLYNQSFPPLVLFGKLPPGSDLSAKQQSSTLPLDEAAGIEVERSTDEMEPSYAYYKRNPDLAPRKKTNDDCSKKEVSAIKWSLNGHGVLAPSNNPRDETSHRRLTLLQQTRPSLVVDGSSCMDDMEQLSADASSSFSSASCQLSLPERRQPVSWPMVVPCRRHSKTFHSVLVQKLVEEGQQALDQRSEATKENGQQHAGRHCSTPTKVAATSKAAAASSLLSPQVPHMLDEKERDSTTTTTTSSSSSSRPSTTKEIKLTDKSAVKGNEGQSIGSSSSSFLLNAAAEAKLQLAMMDLLREMDEMSWAEKQNPVLAEKGRPSTNRQGAKKAASRTNKGAQRQTFNKIGEADTKLMLKGVRATA